MLVVGVMAEAMGAEEKLIAPSESLFRGCQIAWGEQDLAKLKSLLHPKLYPDWFLQIEDQKRRHVKNPMAALGPSNGTTENGWSTPSNKAAAGAAS